MLLISASEIPGLLPMSRAVPLMGEAFRSISGGRASVAHRQALKLETGTGLLMGAAERRVGIGAKLISIMPGNRGRGLPGSVGLVLLMDDASGEALALLDGTSLTSRRTAALNACAIGLLARGDARTGLLVGCGTQASAQLEAMSAARDLDEIRVLGRDTGRVGAFIARHLRRTGPALRMFMDPVAALEGVDIVTAATNSSKPVICGAAVPAGCHVSGVGSFMRGMCEFDHQLLRRADIFVESRETAGQEAGELLAAAETGITRPDRWAEIGEVLAGSAPGRSDDRQVTFFKSVGHAVFDLYAARAIFEAAMEQGAGRSWTP